MIQLLLALYGKCGERETISMRTLTADMILACLDIERAKEAFSSLELVHAGRTFQALEDLKMLKVLTKISFSRFFDLDALTDWVRYTLDKGYAGLWNMRDNDGFTPLEPFCKHAWPNNNVAKLVETLLLNHVTTETQNTCNRNLTRIDWKHACVTL